MDAVETRRIGPAELTGPVRLLDMIRTLTGSELSAGGAEGDLRPVSGPDGIGAELRELIDSWPEAS